jgi:molybdopterin synthase catalytic subunit
MFIIDITQKRILTEMLREALEDSGCGGVVVFEGRVRNHNEGKSVQDLYYECYPAMAKKVLQQIVWETVKKYKVRNISLIHRIGKIPIGEVALWAGVSSIHREESFEACRFLVEAVKHKVPIWKMENYTNGSQQWVECHHVSA